MITIKALRKTDWQKFGARLQELESVAEYPYGADFFRLDHGADYFAFFARMGEPLFHVALDGSRVVACAAGVLRTLVVDGKTFKAWYLCDLKVHPDFRGRQLTTKLFRKNLLRNYFKCSRGYAISMNPANGANRVVKLLKRLPQIPIEYAGQLNFYSFDQIAAASVQPDLEAELGAISYLSLRGKKDLIMQSTNTPLPLFHIQHGAPAANAEAAPPSESPSENGTYMICASENGSLDHLLKNKFPVSATASILAHRLKPQSWDFILTSDI